MIFENMDRIVFAGDSVTDMGSICPIGEDPFGTGLGNGYVREVNSLLAVFYPELVLRVTNVGISGNTSRDLRERWERDVVSLRPQWISICIGINDVWRQFDAPGIPEYAVTPEAYEKNVEEMLLSAKAIAKGVFLMSPYIMEPLKEDRMRARMDEYGAICARLADKHGVPFIDLQAMFDRYFVYRHSAYIAWDRIHPNQVGAMLIAREFLSHCGFDFSHNA